MSRLWSGAVLGAALVAQGCAGLVEAKDDAYRDGNPPAPDGDAGAGNRSDSGPTPECSDCEPQTMAVCGDGDCDGGETHDSCELDCPFVHPGVGVGLVQLDFVKAKIAANEEPWKSALTKAQSSRFGRLTYAAQPFSEVRCTAGIGARYIEAHPELGLTTQGCAEQLNDAAAAYTHALLWFHTGNRAHARKAIEILNAWSATLTAILFINPKTDKNEAIFANGILQAGWAGGAVARAAEILRYTFTPADGEAALDLEKFTAMLRNVYLPLTQVGGDQRDTWNGWGLNGRYAVADATINIGVFLDDQAVYENGLAEYRRQMPASIHMVGDDVSKYANLAGYPVPPQGTAYDKANLALATLQQLWGSPAKYIDGLEGETCRDMRPHGHGVWRHGERR